jgi:hypothetical protein
MFTFINFKYTANATFTEVLFNGEFVCWLLQDTLRPFGIKVKSETGIPAGKAKIRLGQSPRFGKVPFIYNRPDGITYEANGVSFTHLRVHAGNFISHTDGCPLTGTTLSFTKERTYASKDALNYFISLMDDGKEYDLEIINKTQES